MRPTGKRRVTPASTAQGFGEFAERPVGGRARRARRWPSARVALAAAGRMGAIHLGHLMGLLGNRGTQDFPIMVDLLSRHGCGGEDEKPDEACG